ncbi:type I glyceraldehyde-3-phosphate dehydrogenase [Cohnella soli]|uniref:Glyceraldehyde-3-phosphate dehydrogenase n=1 Tax=Cohnella soli TaxID=425005 RepID=A0ABW0HW46_9BACL
MKLRIGISGMGRIGRLCVRKAFSDHSTDYQLTAINSTSPPAVLAHLLKYDSVHGTWDAEVAAEGNDLLINGKRVAIVAERSPESIPWQQFGVELVIDATGKFNDRQGAQRHLHAGVQKVLVTAPGKQMDLTVVMGVNDDRYDPDAHRLLSTASCTTNCLSPVLKVLDDAFGVRQGWMTTIHAFTNDQNHLDNSHKDLRRARSCTSSIIPTSTGVSKALADVLPHLAKHIQGWSVRVPTQDVSLLDLQVDLERSAIADEVREVFRQAVAGKMKEYVGYSELPLVSADYIGNDKSAVIDGLSILTRGNQVKLLAWYDNEWAYASRVMDFTALAGKMGKPVSTKSSQSREKR